jgi:hypothetical protein
MKLILITCWIASIHYLVFNDKSLEKVHENYPLVGIIIYVLPLIIGW